MPGTNGKYSLPKRHYLKGYGVMADWNLTQISICENPHPSGDYSMFYVKEIHIWKLGRRKWAYVQFKGTSSSCNKKWTWSSRATETTVLTTGPPAWITTTWAEKAAKTMNFKGKGLKRAMKPISLWYFPENSCLPSCSSWVILIMGYWQHPAHPS